MGSDADRAAPKLSMTAVTVGSDGTMSTVYERWQPSVGDRVRIVLRDETGETTDSGTTGTIVGLRQETPYAICEVEYDASADGGAEPGRGTHSEPELEPIEATAARGGGQQAAPTGSPSGMAAAWEPTIGDRVQVAGGTRTATITAIDGQGAGTVCEVEYDHQSGEHSEPQRASHPIGELHPTREPSSEALDDDGGPHSEPTREPGPAPI